MNPLGLVSPTTAATAAEPAIPLKLRIDNVLASARRLWLRGQLQGFSSEQFGRWWTAWRKQENPAASPLAHLQTQVSGQTLTAEVPLAADGTWEATFEVPLPSARRGWRVARNQLTLADQKFEACSVVGEPPEAAAGAVVVLLPPLVSEPLGGNLFPGAAHLGKILHGLLPGVRGGQALYYLVRIPAWHDHTAAEVGLLLTSLGWPTGHLVLLDESRLLATVDRLRWLLAEQLEIQLFNLDAAVAPDPMLTPAADRAPIHVHPFGDDTEPAVVKQGPAPRPSRSGLLTRHALVFCHGMLACTLLRMQLSKDHNYFSVLREFLEQRGFRALFPLVLPTGGVIERARQLRDQIRRWTHEPVNLIAHSMGGLDCRYLITHLGMADQVRSLTTISTPHRGTYLADWFQANYRRRVPLLLTLEALGINVDGFRDCQVAACQAFNEQTPDVAGVRYFSYGGDVPQTRVSPMLRRGWALLHAVEGPNDGLVSVASARWGEFLGTIHADHFAQTPDSLFCHPRESFDAVGFYSRLVEDLARRGL